MKQTTSIPFVIAALCIGSPCAQDTARAALVQAQLRIPLHTEHPPGGTSAGETWAAGAGYKASFHNRFEFYPRLGAAYRHNLPLRWHTTASSAGGAGPLASAGARVSDWRFEYRHGDVIERYDVLAAGVEQSFVFTRPTNAGDLIVVGAVETLLVACPQDASHGPLAFRDNAGTEIISYGAAFAIDARGRMTPATTAYDGRQITLRVPAAWVAEAAFPVVLDPLLARGGVIQGAAIADTDIGHDGTSLSQGTLVAVAQESSASDRDVIAFLADSDFNNAVPVFAQLSSSWSMDWPRVAFVSQANRWILVCQGVAAGNYQAILFYGHERRNTLLNSGVGDSLWTTINLRHPDVGGTKAGSSGTQAFVVMERDDTGPQVNSTDTKVLGMFVDPVTLQRSTSVPLAVGLETGLDREYPVVTQVSDGGTASWGVAWQEMRNATGTSAIQCNRIAPDGTHGVQLDVTDRGAGAAAHVKRPAIAGTGGRYMIGYLGGSTWSGDTGRQVHTVRCDWADNSVFGSLRHEHILASTTFGSLSSPRLAYDAQTRSHWGIAYSSQSLAGQAVILGRLGHTGGSVESHAADDGGGFARAGSVSFDPQRGEFGVAFATGDRGGAVFVQRLTYGNAGSSAYGVTCGGQIGAVNPDAGNEFFAVTLGSTSQAGVAALMISVAAANVPLAGLGMPGCSLLVDPSVLISLPTVLVLGVGRVNLPLPDAPVIGGDLFCQWVEFRAGANPAGLVTTQGLQVRVR